MSEWQPIATAPKDGTEILGALPYHGRYDKEDFARRIISWDKDGRGWYDEIEDSYHVHPDSVRYWCPLPAPPDR